MEPEKSPERPKRPTGRGGLFRRFILPQIAIIAVAGGIALVGAGSAQREREKERLVGMVASNVGITNELNLPRSAQLASKLSAISGSTVLFSGAQNEIISPVELKEEQLAAARLAVENAPTAIRRAGYEAAAGRLQSGSESLIIIQKEKSLLDLASGNSTLWPLFGGLVLAIGSAFLIARAVVRPLQNIAGHLDDDAPNEALAIPDSLLKRNDEIGLLARSLVQSREQLLNEQEQRRRVEHLALLGELTTSLAHEIKNPASAISMHAQALEKVHQDGTGELIQEESERIVSLVNQWLFVAKPEAPRLKVNDLAALVRRLSEKLKPLLDFHSVTLKLNVAETLELRCDAQRIEHLFRNLIDNALQAMPSGGVIAITLAKEGGRVSFEVSDQGKGFSGEALSHFGEAFYSEREGGMGLGLALVAGVVKAHGGEVQAENLSPGGAVVKGYFLTEGVKD